MLDSQFSVSLSPLQAHRALPPPQQPLLRRPWGTGGGKGGPGVRTEEQREEEEAQRKGRSGSRGSTKRSSSRRRIAVFQGEPAEPAAPLAPAASHSCIPRVSGEGKLAPGLSRHLRHAWLGFDYFGGCVVGFVPRRFRNRVPNICVCPWEGCCFIDMRRRRWFWLLQESKAEP